MMLVKARTDYPTAQELNLKLVGRRVYEALLKGEQTMDDLRRAVGEKRDEASITMLLRRMEVRLLKYGFEIAEVSRSRDRKRLFLVQVDPTMMKAARKAA